MRGFGGGHRPDREATTGAYFFFLATVALGVVGGKMKKVAVAKLPRVVSGAISSVPLTNVPPFGKVSSCFWPLIKAAMVTVTGFPLMARAAMP